MGWFAAAATMFLFTHWLSRRPIPASMEDIRYRIEPRRWVDFLFWASSASLFLIAIAAAFFTVTDALQMSMTDGFGLSVAASSMGWLFVASRKRFVAYFTSAGVYYGGIYAPWNRIGEVTNTAWILELRERGSGRPLIKIGGPGYAITVDLVRHVEQLWEEQVALTGS